MGVNGRTKTRPQLATVRMSNAEYAMLTAVASSRAVEGEEPDRSETIRALIERAYNGLGDAKARAEATREELDRLEQTKRARGEGAAPKLGDEARAALRSLMPTAAAVVHLKDWKDGVAKVALCGAEGGKLAWKGATCAACLAKEKSFRKALRLAQRRPAKRRAFLESLPRKHLMKGERAELRALRAASKKPKRVRQNAPVRVQVRNAPQPRGKKAKRGKTPNKSRRKVAKKSTPKRHKR